MGFFNDVLGIVGWDDREGVVLSSLAENAKICFVGTHGASKTSICVRLAKALHSVDVKFQRYDGPNVKHDEIFGITNIKALTEGRLEYVKHPQSIWGKDVILWDEINRPNPMLQSKLNEVILENSIHGEKITAKWQFASANPSAKYDAFYLQPQLAARLFFIEAPAPSPEMFLQMMEAEERYNAFDTAPKESLKKQVSKLGGFFLELSSAKPTDAMKKKAAMITAAAMSAMCSEKNGALFPLSLREAKRMTKILERIQIYHKLTNTGFSEKSVTQVVMGHIPHAFGMLAHKYDFDSVINAAKVAYKKILETDPETIILTSADPTSLIAQIVRDRKTDSVTMEHFRDVLMGCANVRLAQSIKYAVRAKSNVKPEVVAVTERVIEVICEIGKKQFADEIIEEGAWNNISWSNPKCVRFFKDKFKENIS